MKLYVEESKKFSSMNLFLPLTERIEVTNDTIVRKIQRIGEVFDPIISHQFYNFYKYHEKVMKLYIDETHYEEVPFIIGYFELHVKGYFIGIIRNV